MDYRGKYQVCSQCPSSKSCSYCSSGYRNDLERNVTSADLIGLAVGLATGAVVGSVVGDVIGDTFDVFGLFD